MKTRTRLISGAGILFISLLFFTPAHADEWDTPTTGGVGNVNNTVWDDAEDTANTVVDEGKKIWDDATNPEKHKRINDLPGNPNDVDKRNVWSAPAIEIYNERREIEYKLKQLKEIEDREKNSWYPDKAKLAAVRENRYRLNQRAKLLGEEYYVRKYVKKNWDGFVPDTSLLEPLDPNRGKKPEAKWGGPLPEVSKVNPAGMGRSEIEPEMRKLNADLKEMRKRLDRMKAVDSFSGNIGQKRQVEDKIKEITRRLNALDAEKKKQVKNGTWPSSSKDITRTTADADDINKAYQDGYDLARRFKNGNLTSDEVRHATQDAYGRYSNNPKLKDAFKRGYRAGQ